MTRNCHCSLQPEARRIIDDYVICKSLTDILESHRKHSHTHTHKNIGKCIVRRQVGRQKVLYWQITSSGAPIPHRYLEASKRLDSRLLRLNPYRLRRPSKTYQEIVCLTSNEGTEAIGENRNKSKVACSVQRKTISELSTAMNNQREEMMSLRWPVTRSGRRH